MKGELVSKMTEIRWHARAGQGAVTAAKLVADTALGAGAYIQAMPEYGPERTGAPLKAYTRLSDEPIEVHNSIRTPDIVVVLDETLLDIVDCLEGIKQGATVILNTSLNPEDARKKLGADDSIRVAVVNASDIALSTIKRDIPNTPIVGALAKVTGVVKVDDVKSRLRETFGKKFSEDVINANLNSVDRAFEEVSE